MFMANSASTYLLRWVGSDQLTCHTLEESARVFKSSKRELKIQFAADCLCCWLEGFCENCRCSRIDLVTMKGA